MATMPMLPGAPQPNAGGVATGIVNSGLPVLGNRTGNNQYSPLGGATPTSSVPGAGGGIAGNGVTAMTTALAPINTGVATPSPVQAMTTSSTAPAAPGVTAAPPDSSGATAGDTSKQQQQIAKQLTDTYGKGEGTLLGNLINNIGSNDSSYMQAYQQAMAGSNAEGQATLDTQMGNSGVSANSSTAAIANADYAGNVTSQEGLQEQNLQQHGMDQTVGLVQGLQQGSSAEVSSGGFLQDIGGILNAGAANAGSLAGAASKIGWI